MAEITREERDDAREGYTAAYGHGTLVHKLLDALDAAEAEELEARAELLTAIARAEAAEAREAKLREVLQVIAAPCGTEGPLWATMHARSALAQGGA